MKPKSLRQAEDGRDALARELYSSLFYGVIDKVNTSLHGQPNEASTFAG
jgi:myosin heavy subunit